MFKSNKIYIYCRLIYPFLILVFIMSWNLNLKALSVIQRKMNYNAFLIILSLQSSKMIFKQNLNQHFKLLKFLSKTI